MAWHSAFPPSTQRHEESLLMIKPQEQIPDTFGPVGEMVRVDLDTQQCCVCDIYGYSSGEVPRWRRFIHRAGLISSSVSEVARGECRSREEVSSKQIKVTLYLLIWSDLKGSEGRRERQRERCKSLKAVCERDMCVRSRRGW